MAELPRYGTVESCPKCGAAAGAGSAVESDATTVYHSGRMPRDAPAPPCSGAFYADLGLGEHMCRTCQACGYGWCEAVLKPGPVTGGTS